MLLYLLSHLGSTLRGLACYSISCHCHALAVPSVACYSISYHALAVPAEALHAIIYLITPWQYQQRLGMLFYRLGMLFYIENSNFWRSVTFFLPTSSLRTPTLQRRFRAGQRGAGPGRHCRWQSSAVSPVRRRRLGSLSHWDTAWPLGQETVTWLASMIRACRSPPRLAGSRRTTGGGLRYSDEGSGARRAGAKGLRLLHALAGPNNGQGSRCREPQRNRFYTALVACAQI